MNILKMLELGKVYEKFHKETTFNNEAVAKSLFEQNHKLVEIVEALLRQFHIDKVVMKRSDIKETSLIPVELEMLQDLIVIED